MKLTFCAHDLQTFSQTNARLMRLKPGHAIPVGMPASISHYSWVIAVIGDHGLGIMLPYGIAMYSWEELRTFFEWSAADNNWHSFERYDGIY